MPTPTATPDFLHATGLRNEELLWAPKKKRPFEISPTPSAPGTANSSDLMKELFEISPPPSPVPRIIKPYALPTTFLRIEGELYKRRQWKAYDFAVSDEVDTFLSFRADFGSDALILTDVDYQLFAAGRPVDALCLLEGRNGTTSARLEPGIIYDVVVVNYSDGRNTFEVSLSK